MSFNFLYQNKKIANLIWAFRGLLGQTEENRKEKYFLRKTGHMLGEYMAVPGSKKLNIGSQGNNLEGWLNTDLWASPAGVAFLDATKPFPFPDQSFDYVYSEHMIEHITYDQGCFMIKESYRVLKNGGKIRIATPSLDKFKTFTGDEDMVRNYFDQHVKKTYGNPVTCTNDFILNYIFYNFYHKFIYGHDSIKQLLSTCHFKDIAFFSPGKSNDPNLKGLERHQVCLGEEFNNLETMVVEATRMAI